MFSFRCVCCSVLSLGHMSRLYTDFILYCCVTSQASWTPLHIAASAGREDIVRSLISKGAQLNSVNQNGCTPLHYAASKDRYEVRLPGCRNGDWIIMASLELANIYESVCHYIIAIIFYSQQGYNFNIRTYVFLSFSFPKLLNQQWEAILTMVFNAFSCFWFSFS